MPRAPLLAAPLLATVMAASALPAAATPYDSVYAFGDSLTDNGNLAEVYYQKNLPNPPSYHDSFTNGPVAVQVLAQSLGLQLNPSLWVTAFTDPHNLFGGPSFVPGTNYAVASATSAAQAVGGPPGINLPQQVAAFGAATGLHADPNALYVVMIGGNDVRNAAIQGTGAAAVNTGVNTELAAITTLAGEGAKNFLVVNVPNVGIIPEFNLSGQDGYGKAAAATTDSQLYNSELAVGLAGLGLPSADSLSLFDLYAFNNNVLANAASYGFTDTTDPCFTSTPLSSATTPACGPGGANIGSFIYWDAIHPTARVQALWGQGMEQALGVPEPASLGLLGLGVLAALTRRKRPAA